MKENSINVISAGLKNPEQENLPVNKSKNILGIDLGSRNVKVCLFENGEPGFVKSFDTIIFYREYGYRTESGFKVDLNKLRISGFDKVIATGYGRSAADISGAETISELTAHFTGAKYQTGLGDFILVDIGGQDFKIIKSEKGRMTDMAANDKCAASTGRYVENMASVLGIPLDEMSKYHENPAVLSSTCAIFGESEIIGLIVKGAPPETLAAGVNMSVAERIMPFLERMDGPEILLSGGVALNDAVAFFIRQKTGMKTTILPDPAHNGAIGCCAYGIRK